MTKRPTGTYVEGYDAGLADSHRHLPRQVVKVPCRRVYTDYERGYLAGYEDAQVRVKETR